MTKIIGLTGGIGSGKTTIAKYFESFGIPIYIADERAKILTNSPEVIKLIKSQFGETIFDGDNLNRKKLADIVFNDAEKLKLLNLIIHPLVKIDFEQWLANHSNASYVIKETAILFESKSNLQCDIIIAIVSPIELRIERILLRDHLSKNEILAKINNQLSDKELITKSDFIITNTNLDISKMQVRAILKKLKII